MTRRLVTYIQIQSLRRSLTHLAHEIGLDEKTIRLIFNAYVTELDRQAIVEAPEWLGIDELTLAQRPRCIFTDVKQKRLVGLISNRKKPAVNIFLSKLDKRDRVELVTITMWPSYCDAARDFFPRAALEPCLKRNDVQLRKILDGLTEELPFMDADRKGIVRERMQTWITLVQQLWDLAREE